MATSSSLLEHIRRADPDRFFCSLFAPAGKRETLWLLFAFNHELARAREVASEPVLALLRLTWWREVVDGVEKNHDIAMALQTALAAGVLERADLARLIDAREMEAAPAIETYDAFMNYARNTAGLLARVSGKVLGADCDAAQALGTAYGISGILRAAPFLAARARSLLPADGTREDTLIGAARELLRQQVPRALLPAVLPAAFARRDLGRPYRPRSLSDRLAVVRSAISGRI